MMLAVRSNNVATYVSELSQTEKDVLVFAGHCNPVYVGLTDAETAVCDNLENCCTLKDNEPEELVYDGVTLKGYNCLDKSGLSYQAAKGFSDLFGVTFPCIAKYLSLSLLAGLTALLN